MKSIALFVLTCSTVFLAAGCNSTPDMPAGDAANFKGKPGGSGAPMTPEQQKAMASFKDDFQKKHPSTGGPGQPPASEKAPGG